MCVVDGLEAHHKQKLRPACWPADTRFTPKCTTKAHLKACHDQSCSRHMTSHFLLQQGTLTLHLRQELNQPESIAVLGHT